MTWGGLPRRRLDQQRQPMGGTMGPGTPNTFLGRLVIVFGPGGTVTGVFVYTPGTTPGPGNPPVGFITASLKDPYGNPIPGAGLGAVVGTANGNASARLNNSSVLLAADVAPVVPAALTQLPAGVLNLDSGGLAVADPSGTLFVFSQALGGVGAPGASLGTGAALYGTDPASGAPQTWQYPPLLNGWANNASFGPFGYRPVGSPPNSLEFTGALSAAAAASSLFFQIPALYGTPKTASGRPVHTNVGNAGATAVAGVRWDTAGNLTIASNAALPNGATYFLGFTLPMDA